MGMMSDVYDAALHVIDEGTSRDETFIVTFNRRPELISDFTSDRHRLENSILGLTADGETALFDAVEFALDPARATFVLVLHEVATTGCASYSATISGLLSGANGSGSCECLNNTDTQPPSITCPGGLTKFTDSGQLTATVNPGTPVATDNCTVQSVTGVRSDGKALNAPYPVGVTLITWKATDLRGNMASCAQSLQ